MKSFDRTFLEQQAIPLEMGGKLIVSKDNFGKKDSRPVRKRAAQLQYPILQKEGLTAFVSCLPVLYPLF